jgi:hypothetical protein
VGKNDNILAPHCLRELNRKVSETAKTNDANTFSWPEEEYQWQNHYCA